MKSNMAGNFQIQTLPIIGGYNVQRFRQFGCEDTAGWYVKKGDNTKRPYSMYPQLGRAHINVLGLNQLIFGKEPRGLFKSIRYAYVVSGSEIIRVDNQFNRVTISGAGIATNAGPIYFTFLVVQNIVFACFVDADHIYIYREDTGIFTQVTDPRAPGGTGNTTKPGFIATFGNRIVVSTANSSQFNLSTVNLDGNSFNANTCFTVAGAAVFAQEEGIIRQMGVLNNTLYIFTDYITGVWSNSASIFNVTGGGTVSFPWNKNSTYDWNFGIANPKSLSIDFGMLVFLAQNADGLIQFMMSTGGQPQRISDSGIDTLMQRYTNQLGQSNPFISLNSNGFLYQYENTIFYRISGGNYTGTGLLDQELTANSIEYGFENKEWHRCIEMNGERNRVQLHIYFSFRHLVTVVDDGTIYNMSGQYYYNELRNPNQSDAQAADAYIAYPFRYERNTPIISQDDYAEFETEYVQIDFVFGESNINYSLAPFSNTTFIIDEQLLNGQIQYLISENADSSGEPVYIIADGNNTDSPAIGELTYNTLFKPSIELFFSDDAGISFQSADVRQFSQMGVYQWRMRWYQLGPSRNRVYKLVCVSPVPIVVLGGVMNVRRISGGAN